MFKTNHVVVLAIAIFAMAGILHECSAQPSGLVAMFDKDSTVVQLGDTERVVLTVKNTRDTNATYDVYIGSTDAAFRNFIWFENHKNDQYRVYQKVDLGSHEEKGIVVNVFGGKVNNYNLLVGPDGSDVNNVYDSISIKVADTGNNGLFSNTPDIGILWVVLVPVAASIILLTRKSR